MSLVQLKNGNSVKENELYKSLSFTIQDMIYQQGGKLQFYSYYLIPTDRVFTSGNHMVQTAGVMIQGTKFKLAVNADFWIKHNALQRMFLCAHESMHIIYGHPLNYSNYDHKIYNIATDLFINSILIETMGVGAMPGCGDTAKWNNTIKPQMNQIFQDLQDGKITKEEAIEKQQALPGRPVHPDDFDGLDIKKCIDKGSDWIYQYLLKNYPQLKDKVYVIQCQSNEMPHESDHKEWSKIDKIPEGIKKIIEINTHGMLKEIKDNIEKGRGTIPGHLSQHLDAILNPPPPVTDWKQLMRNFIGGRGTKMLVKRTKLKPHLIIQDNYRLRFIPNKHWLFMLDTSGSMGIKRDIPEVLTEACNIQKLTNATVTVAEVDTRVHNVWKMKSLQQMNKRLDEHGISGRGGTSIDCINDFLKKNQHERFSAIVYLTDGEVSPPTQKPKIPMLVLKSSYGSMYNKESWEEQGYKIIEIPKEYYEQN